MIVVAVISLLLFYVYSAVCEAGYFHIRNVSKIKLDHEHQWLVAMRITVWTLFYLVVNGEYLFSHILYYFHNYSFWFALIELIYSFRLVAAAMLVFPFIHDGVYYFTRYHLDETTYPLGFFDYSHDDNALISLNLSWRLTLLIVGLALSFI